MHPVSVAFPLKCSITRFASSPLAVWRDPSPDVKCILKKSKQADAGGDVGHFSGSPKRNFLDRSTPTGSGYRRRINTYLVQSPENHIEFFNESKTNLSFLSNLQNSNENSPQIFEKSI